MFSNLGSVFDVFGINGDNISALNSVQYMKCEKIDNVTIKITLSSTYTHGIIATGGGLAYAGTISFSQ